MISKLQDLKERHKASPVRASAGLGDAAASAIPAQGDLQGFAFSNQAAVELDAVLKRRHDQLIHRLDRQEESLQMILAATANVGSQVRNQTAQRIIENTKREGSMIRGTGSMLMVQDRLHTRPSRHSFRRPSPLDGTAPLDWTPSYPQGPRKSLIALATTKPISHRAVQPTRVSSREDLGVASMTSDYGLGSQSVTVKDVPQSTSRISAQVSQVLRENGLDKAVEHKDDVKEVDTAPHDVPREEAHKQDRTSSPFEPKASAASLASSAAASDIKTRFSEELEEVAQPEVGRGSMASSVPASNQGQGIPKKGVKKQGTAQLKALRSRSLQVGNTISLRDRIGSTWSTGSDEDRLRKSAAQEIAEVHVVEDDDDADDKYCLPCRGRLRRLTTSYHFEIFFAVLIITNAVYVGIQVEYNVSYAEDNEGGQSTPVVFYVVGYAYNTAFLVELLLRIYAEGPYFFCSRTQWTWNYLDVIIVTSSCMEVVLDIVNWTSDDSEDTNDTGGLTNMRILRMLRITRLTRVLRIVRIVRFVRALRTLVYSIISTLKSLVWAMLLLVIIIYVFGILFTQGVSDYLVETLDSDINEEDMLCDDAKLVLRRYYGSLPKSMYTLFKAVSGGISWDVVVEPLGSASPIFVMFFTGFIAFVYFAVLNVVTGVFCQSAIESAAHDADMAVHAQLANKKMYIDKVRALFLDIDADDSGFITINEFEKYLRRDEIQAYFGSLELDISDAWTLFKLLDQDESNVVDIEEFVTGCLRLKGGAKAIDIQQLMLENKAIGKRLANFMRYVETQFQTFDDMADLIRLITQHSKECPLLLPMMDMVDTTGYGSDSMESLDSLPREPTAAVPGNSQNWIDTTPSTGSAHSHGHGHGHGHAHGHGHSH